jgi:hypothetical protein
VDQLGPNALGETLEPGRGDDCSLGLLLPPRPAGEPEAGTEGRYQVFEVTPQQYELIGRRVPEVIVRQKLWDQGVRFGAGVNQGKYHVLIDPGFSGLTARQVLNRLLGNP